tara:strand:- start:3763 stop:4467 length:705 start_codon:yes stop_codon:yes gene_type:complete
MATSDIKKGPLYVDSTSNLVGVGTSAPSGAKVDIFTGSTATDGLKINRFGSGTYYSTLRQDTHGLAIRVGDGSNIAERVAITPNGITFNGDTAAANALDDYEEGTFTPVVKYGSGSSFTTITSPNNAIGVYRKIGALLYISFYFYKSSSPIGGSGGLWRVQGFPFTLIAGSTAAYQSVPVGYWTFNGVNYFNSIPSRWQANGSDYLGMYGAQGSTAWSSGAYEVAGSGFLVTTS